MNRAVADWQSNLDALPANHPRRWGERLIGLGAIALLLAMFATPPWASLGAALALAGVLLSRAPLHRLPWLWIGLAYGGWLVLSGVVAWGQGLEGARWRPAGPAWTWLATPLVALGLARAAHRRIAWIALATLAAASVLLAALQFAIGLGDGPLKIDPAGARWQVSRGFSEHHLTFGLACAILLVSGIQPRTVVMATAATAWTVRAAAMLGLLVCGSRAAVLGACAGAWASCTARGRRWALIGLGLVVVGGGALAARFATTDPDRFAQSLHLQDGRWPIWRTSLALAAEQPILGWGGKDAFKAAYRDAFPRVQPGAVSEFPDGAPHAHNATLSLVAEYGLPALVLHLVFWATALVWLWRRRLEAPEAWSLGLGVVAVAVVGGMFEPYPTRVVQSTAIHAALGLALALALLPVQRASR